MGQKIRELSLNIKKSMQNPAKRKAWQSGIGIGIFVLFVLSSVMVNRSVQALNQAAGNYGYYGGTYGYNETYTSSDFAPSAPTILTSSSTTSTVTFSWTAPTTTSGGTELYTTGLGYCYTYGTSSQSTCTLTDSTTASASVTISGLTCGSTEYIAVRAYDTNQNLSSALTGSATVTACAGTPPSGGTTGPSTGPSYPTATPTVATVTAPVATVTTTVAADAVQLTAQLGVQRNTASEVAYQAKVVSSTLEFKVTLGATDLAIATNFVTYGTASQAVHNLGSGERLALVRDQLEVLGRVSLTALEQLANGQKPTDRNLANEQKQVSKVLKIFQKLTNITKPDFKNSKQDLAWNTLQYRIRFARDLNKERAGIGKFKALYGKTPKTPLEWAAVRAYGYALK